MVCKNCGAEPRGTDRDGLCKSCHQTMREGLASLPAEAPLVKPVAKVRPVTKPVAKVVFNPTKARRKRGADTPLRG